MQSKIVISCVIGVLALAAARSPAQTSAGPAAPAASCPPAPGSDGGPAVIARSTVHRFQSAIVDDVYELRVALPDDYENDDALRPVVYALDGQWNFTLLAEIIGKLSFDGSIPDPILVGVTWADAGYQPAAERARDFSPEPDPEIPGSGGASQFLRVLEQEVFPLVESKYRASTERVITGGSFSGLFVSYALVERPDLFLGYVSSSGATGLAPEFFTERLSEISPESLRHERAYFSVGELHDSTAEVQRFFGELEDFVGKRNELELEVIPGVGHTGNETFGYLRGLLHAFERPRLRLSERFLDRYEGEYADPLLPDLPPLSIEAERGALYIVEDGERWPFEFYAASTDSFYAEGYDMDLRFYQTDDGTQAFTLNIQRFPEELLRR